MENKEIIFGRNPVFEYLKSTKSSNRIELYVSKTAHGKIIDAIKREAGKKGIKPLMCEKEVFKKYTSSSKHQGVIIIAPRSREASSDTEFIEQVKQKKGVLVLLDQLTDPHNVGSIIRTTEAIGGDAVIVPKAHSAQMDSVVTKASAGAIAHLRIITIPNVANFIDNAHKSGFWIVGTSHDGDTDLSKLKNLKPAVIIIGSEGKGMRRLTEDKCDYIVKVPLRGRITSLNASVAAGIILYEMLKSP